uniref:Hemogen isoform X1 n=1 Tax=Sus scrofa TaxID=9823 RepID=A0A480F4F9_PIG
MESQRTSGRRPEVYSLEKWAKSSAGLGDTRPREMLREGKALLGSHCFSLDIGFFFLQQPEQGHSRGICDRGGIEAVVFRHSHSHNNMGSEASCGSQTK